MKVSEFLSKIEEAHSGILRLSFTGANLEEPVQTYLGFVFTGRNVKKQEGDYVIKTGVMETNLSKVERLLKSFVNKGVVTVRLLNSVLFWDFVEGDEDTYDVQFDDENNSNEKGFRLSAKECLDYILQAQPDESYFADYHGGTVSIVCNETGETIYQIKLR